LVTGFIPSLSFISKTPSFSPFCFSLLTAVQGVLISSNDGNGPLLLDDGTAVIQLSLSGEFRQRQFKAGKFTSFVLSIGHFEILI
jgi:hypothetical protein